MKLATTTLSVQTKGAGPMNITRDVEAWLTLERAHEGQLTLFIRHTSASLLIQENADPDVLKDLEAFMQRLVPWRSDLYAHRTEGPDDMPAHIRAALTQTSIGIPVAHGAPVLGTWQGIYLFEHRARPHRRQVTLHIIGQ
jgi:secondary thiamine-phosphate synthase enzyme